MKIAIAFGYTYQEIKWSEYLELVGLNRRHVYWDNVAPSGGMKACARGRHPISMQGKWRLMSILKALLQLLLAQKLISIKCVRFKSNLLPSDTVPLIFLWFWKYTIFILFCGENPTYRATYSYILAKIPIFVNILKNDHKFSRLEK